MRELKFRAWDDLNKKWLLGYEYPNLGGFSMMGEVMAFGEYNKMLDSFKLEDWHYIKLMQYTGLKDKNGREIYEGDIVTCITKSDFQFPNKGVVEYLAPFFAIYVGKDYIKEDEPKLYTWFYYNENFEVIGNIYQNPELLTQKN